VTPVRIVHVGDVHLQHGHPRNALRLQSLDQIVIEQRDAAALWLIPGDLFHQRSVAEDRNALAERLLIMAAVAPIVMVRGNHDAPNDLDIFARLQGRWPIHVVTQPTVIDVALPTGDHAAIAVVPYPDRAGLVAAGVTKADVPQTAVELLDVIFMQLAHELSVARVGGALPLFCGHFNVKGAISSTLQPQIGHEQEVDRLSLARLGAAYCALSHIHKAQEVGVGVYAGSIAPQDFGEVEEKSYVVVEAVRVGSEWTATWTRQPLHTPRLVHIEGDLTPTGFVPTSAEARCSTCAGSGAGERDPREGMLSCRACGGSGRRSDWSGCEVRVRYRCKASEKSLLNEQPIRDAFASALRLKIESVVEPDRDVRSPAVAQETTIEGKLTAYLGGTAAPGVLTKLTALQTTDGDQILRDVTAQLAVLEQPERATVAA
jgi:DNA repair exonuclease SbcCD nuclease subunit